MVLMDDFMQDVLHKIVCVNSSEEEDGFVYATLTTKQFGRKVIKPYKFTLEEWGEIQQRRWLE